MKNRKIIQLVCRTNDVYALCDDGTVWFLWAGKWHPTPAIPQEDK